MWKTLRLSMLFTPRLVMWSSFVFILIGCGSGNDSNRDIEINDIDAFLEQHWVNPLPPQGEPPANFTKPEASLDPAACGECHATQLQQWQTSLHAHTMTDGIQWQLQLMDQQQGNRCLRCHAPLAEQKALLALQRGWPNVPDKAVPDWLPTTLADSGLVCAVCHVRRHQRYGPPPRQQLRGDLPHDGFIVNAAFQDSRFCANCHQHHERDNPPRVNGKLQEDTWNQWQQSPQAAQKIHCQSCHMPDRQHLWRGIHDPEMTRKALQVELEVKRMSPTLVTIEVVLQNKGAGHHFPTYMVPKVEVVFSLLDPDTGSTQEFHRYTIGWWVNVALTEELFDTRIAAGETRKLRIPLQLPETGKRLATKDQTSENRAKDGWEIVMTLNVLPREHYERTFEQSMQYADKIPEPTLAVLRNALQQAQAAHYRLLTMKKTVPAWNNVAN